MMMRPRPRTLLALALAATAACASAEPKRSFGKPALTPAVFVSNHHFLDVNIFAEQSGMRWRLGTVTGNSSQAFRLPRSLPLQTGRMRLVVDPIGEDRAYTSQPVYVRSGQELDLIVGSSLSQSSLAVYN
jgi:hypothetical protein